MTVAYLAQTLYVRESNVMGCIGSVLTNSHFRISTDTFDRDWLYERLC